MDMQRIQLPARGYSAAEQVSDAAIHITGVVCAMMGVPVLVTLSLFWSDDWATIMGILVYGATLILMLLSSALYHILPAPGWRGVLWRLDHSAIYFKIAGTYTLFGVLAGGSALWLIPLLWSAALVGVLLKILAPTQFRTAALLLYIAMGWAGVLVGGGVFADLSNTAFGLVLAGGMMYTGGVAFFLADWLPFHKTIWHAMVLVASAVIFSAVAVELSAAAM